MAVERLIFIDNTSFPAKNKPPHAVCRGKKLTRSLPSLHTTQSKQVGNAHCSICWCNAEARKKLTCSVRGITRIFKDHVSADGLRKGVTGTVRYHQSQNASKPWGFPRQTLVGRHSTVFKYQWLTIILYSNRREKSMPNGVCGENFCCRISTTPKK